MPPPPPGDSALLYVAGAGGTFQQQKRKMLAPPFPEAWLVQLIAPLAGNQHRISQACTAYGGRPSLINDNCPFETTYLVFIVRLSVSYLITL